MNACWIRVDSSKQIGTGHVYRCLSIAEQVKRHFHVVFICRLFDGHLIDLIQKKGFEVIALAEDLSEWSQAAREQSWFDSKPLKHSAWLQSTQAEDALATQQALKGALIQCGDVLLLDHFALDADWEGFIQNQLGLSVIVIDGQADRKHVAKVVVDPTVCSKTDKWKNLLADTNRTSFYQGSAYIPLASDFFQLREQVQSRSNLKSILIAFGGVDLYDFTGAALKAVLEMSLSNLQIDVVVGQNYSNLPVLKSICDKHDQVNCHVQTTKMPELILHADLAIGAGGSIAWERCLLGLPTLVAVIADNQRAQVDCLVSKGVALPIGDQVEQIVPAIQTAIDAFLQNPQVLTKMSSAAMALMDNVTNDQWLTIFESM